LLSFPKVAFWRFLTWTGYLFTSSSVAEISQSSFGKKWLLPLKSELAILIPSMTSVLQPPTLGKTEELHHRAK